MTGVLSQKEIDELLMALNTGVDEPSDAVVGVDAESGPEIKEYNFRTANKFSKEQIKTLQLIYENYAGRLSTFLSGKLRALCEVEVVSIEELSFSEFINSMPSPVLLSIFNMPPLQGNILFEVSPTIAYEIISRLFGGVGQASDTYKPFTEIELSILDRIIRNMLKVMDEAWEKVTKVNCYPERLETSTQFAQIVEANEPIAIITINVKIGDVSNTLNICIPHLAVQPISKQLAMKKWYSDSLRNIKYDTKNDTISKQLSSTELTLHAVFDTTRASVREVLSLQVGDVIRIDHTTDTPVTIKVEHLPKVKGLLGTQGAQYAVKITDILRKEDD